MALKDASIQEVIIPNNTRSMQIASVDDYAHCHLVMVNASNNYSFASNFLPSEKRHHVDALYAFLRIGDDRVDVSHEGYKSPLQAIDAWEEAYWGAFETGNSPDPVMRAYLSTAIENGIPANIMSPYFRAMRDDLVKTRFTTFEELLHYMDGSAIPVGRAMTYILEVREPYTFSEAFLRADDLSIAMQLSNFWRDIGHDWQIGRVYLPQEDMEIFEVSEDDLATGRISSRFIELLEFEISRTEGYYDLARRGVQMLASGQWGVMSSLLVYQAILGSIRENEYDVFSRHAGSNFVQKVAFMFKSWQVIRKSSNGMKTI
jgi:phytoene synthase